MTLRPATLADLPAIAALQTVSWQAAYRSFVPEHFLLDEVPELLRRHWTDWPGPDWRIDVVCDGPAVVGFVATDLAHDGGPYIDNLHVAPAAHRRGVGRALMAAAATHALSAGRIWLTVIEGNGPARAAYRAWRGQEGSPRIEHLYGQPVRALPITWNDTSLRRLAGHG